MPFSRIITHPGGAHKDDFLACALLLAVKGVPLLRREPDAAELADPEVCVVDVGHQHIPHLHNFDHHQFAPEHPPTCSLSLVLQYLGLYEEACNFCDWLQPAEWLDCRGAVATADWMGIERDVLNRLNSPVDISLLRQFARQNELKPGDPLWEIMCVIGRDLIDYVSSMRDRMQFISGVCAWWHIEVSGGPCKILFVPRTDPLPEDPSLGLERYIELHSNKSPKVAGMVYPDSRNPGFALSRHNDCAALDFTRIEGEADIHFAHKRGFIAKTSATDPLRLQQLIAQAWVS